MNFLANLWRKHEKDVRDEETRRGLTNVLRFLATRHDSDQIELLLTRETFQPNKYVNFYAKGSACWMRIKRPAALKDPTDTIVRRYLQQWLPTIQKNAVREITLDDLRVAPRSDNTQVKSYLRRLRKRLLVQQYLDPLYDRLLGISNEQVYWGFGSCNDKHILQVALEVNWQRDGSILLQPKAHFGVRFNPLLTKDLPHDLRKEEFDCSTISPATLETYQNILESCGLADVDTTTWSIFAKEAPVSSMARDASRWADGCREGDIPLASQALVHGAGQVPFLPPIEAPVHFPLPTSDAQMQIAKLLFEGAPAVVCEGPPGSGKTTSIANIVCAYLCQGKRVLVTSKAAPALSVLRARLPEALQSLCVDVSLSESSGLRQLQVTVERLVDKVAMTTANKERSELLQKSINTIEQQIEEIDKVLLNATNEIRELLENEEGKALPDLAASLADEVPWLNNTTSEWKLSKITAMKLQIEALLRFDDYDVTGFASPPSDLLVSFVAAKAGRLMSTARVTTRRLVSSIPIIGSISGIAIHDEETDAELAQLQLRGKVPEKPAEWAVVLETLEYTQDLHRFQEEWNSYHRVHGWPDINFVADGRTQLRRVLNFVSKLERKRSTEESLGVKAYLEELPDSESLGVRRKTLSNQLQQLRKELTEASVISVLSESFSPEAQSALIKFAQIAAQAKFSKVTQLNRMTQRQKRKRQEYLDAFDKCCRFIPCWIMTSSQICDFLPPECLFDLVVVDEASQSDSSVLPGMLRGRQWLIVGDSKQVSPTEAFVSEDQIENLQASLPDSPLADALLPGQSFFDLGARAFPRHRVVLEEHFRCAEEIIRFSNEHFYDWRLVPLRMPTQSERLSPSIIDVFLQNGEKIGKTNEREADRIVDMIAEEIEEELDSGMKPRSIGVISLMGDEQSRMIRGRLLDRIGAEAMIRHDILVGDSPTFQGAERDIVFLSMVCSPGSCPVQTQLTHWQRANVAMSRARDRCVLVRSIRLTDVTAQDDIKSSIIRFFEAASQQNADGQLPNEGLALEGKPIVNLLIQTLRKKGYSVQSMNDMIRAGCFCVEDHESDSRVAITVDCASESEELWNFHYERQKAIQRVGWQCLRVNGLSLISDFEETVRKLESLVDSYGIRKQRELDNQDANSNASESDDDIETDQNMHEIEGMEEVQIVDPPEQRRDQDVITISSDDSDAKPPAKIKIEPRDNRHDEEAAQYGEIVDVDIPERGLMAVEPQAATATVNRRRANEDEASQTSSKRRRLTYRRLDRYSRDGRWHPGSEAPREEPEWFDYDTDSDLNPDEASI